MKTTFSQLKPTTLSSRIAQSIEEAIMRGDLKPGERISAHSLAQQFKVSHIPVREALKRLEAIGVIVQEPNIGARVPELSSEEIKKILEVRKVLEGLAVCMAAPKMDEHHQQQLAGLVSKMRAASKSKDFIGMFAADNEFHRILWDLTGNPFLVKSLGMLLLPYFGYLAARGYYAHREQLSYVPQVHQEILDALSTRDGDLARKAIQSVHDRSIQWLPPV